MDDYADSLEKIQVDKKRDKDEETTYRENCDLRELIGKIAWLSQNLRPDLSYGTLSLQKRVNNSTISDIRYVNKLVDKSKNRKNKIHFVKVGKPEDLVVFGLGDASYTAGQGKNSAIKGKFILIGTKHTNKVSSLFWKTKTIKQVCKSPKDSETINACMLCDKTRHLANQMSDLLFGKNGRRIPAMVFTDSLGTLESIASTKQVERNLTPGKK